MKTKLYYSLITSLLLFSSLATRTTLCKKKIHCICFENLRSMGLNKTFLFFLGTEHIPRQINVSAKKQKE